MNKSLGMKLVTTLNFINFLKLLGECLNLSKQLLVIWVIFQILSEFVRLIIVFTITFYFLVLLLFLVY